MFNIYIIKHFSNNPNITTPTGLSQPYIASATIENKSWNPLLTYHVLFGGLTFESFRHQIQTISSPDNGCEHHQNCRNRTAIDINGFLIYYLLSLFYHILSVRLLQGKWPRPTPGHGRWVLRDRNEAAAGSCRISSCRHRWAEHRLQHGTKGRTSDELIWMLDGDDCCVIVLHTVVTV